MGSVQEGRFSLDCTDEKDIYSGKHYGPIH
jgi:hypothetical protein